MMCVEGIVSSSRGCVDVGCITNLISLVALPQYLIELYEHCPLHSD